MRIALKLGLATAMAIGAISLSPVVRHDGALKANAMTCHYYSNWFISGGSIICYNPGGSACVVCGN
jgi:hypothetical protein